MNSENIWEQLETHMHDNLGIYGLEMMDAFLELKEQAEDRGMSPPDTEERQTELEKLNGYNMTKNEATEFVQDNARYYDDGSFEPYAVMYQGKFIWAKSPGDLVGNLLEFVNG